jgi:DNA-binding CsgD family transcriptional regulator
MNRLDSDDKGFLDFILTKMPSGLIVFNDKIKVVYMNRTAEHFTHRYKIPDEVAVICGRIFSAITAGKFDELFPGEIILYRKPDNSTNSWIFRIHMYKAPSPLIAVYISEEKLSDKITLNERRIQFRLTRRELDVLRRVVDGLSNSEISEDCEISEYTVKDHLSSILSKFGVKNRFELICALTQASRSETDLLHKKVDPGRVS